MWVGGEGRGGKTLVTGLSENISVTGNTGSLQVGSLRVKREVSEVHVYSVI